MIQTPALKSIKDYFNRISRICSNAHNTEDLISVSDSIKSLLAINLSGLVSTANPSLFRSQISYPLIFTPEFYNFFVH